MIEKQNTLEWLDFIVTVALDFSESEVDTLSAAQHGHITKKIHEQKRWYTAFLNRQRLAESSNLSQLVKAHHGSLLFLLDQASKAISRINPLNTLTADALSRVVSCVYELLGFVQDNFAEYLDLDDPVPDAYLTEFARQHQLRVSQVKIQLTSKNADPGLIEIVADAVGAATGRDSSARPNFRMVFYQREVLSGLEHILHSATQVKIDDSLVELLIYLNFNSRPFMDYYTRHMVRKIGQVEQVQQKVDELLLNYKYFKQMHRKSGLKFSRADLDLRKFISNWFTQEIGYYKERSELNLTVNDYSTSVKARTEPFKLMVMLSVDQIGLFLRAVDSLRMIKARSMNTVFESIVPFLSTPRKTEISWDSMRSKSYSFEEKDKQTVIKALESIIDWIKEY